MLEDAKILFPNNESVDTDEGKKRTLENFHEYMRFHLQRFQPRFHMIATIAKKRSSAIVAIVLTPLSSDRSDNDR